MVKKQYIQNVCIVKMKILKWMCRVNKIQKKKLFVNNLGVGSIENKM